MSTKKLKFFKFIIDRLFKSKSSFNLSSIVLKISIFSITLAIAILIPVMSIMNGFEFEFKNRILNLVPHSTIIFDQPTQEWESKIDEIKKLPYVYRAEPLIKSNAFINLNQSLHPILLRGVDFKNHQDYLAKYLLNKEKINIYDNEIILSSKMLNDFQLKIGDTVSIFNTNKNYNKNNFLTNIDIQPFVIINTYNTGTEIDNYLSFINFPVAMDINNQTDIQEIHVQYHDIFSSRYYAAQLLNKIDNIKKISDWSHQFGNLYHTIQLSSDIVLLIVGSIVIISIFNLFVSMIMLVKNKTQQIAIMKTIGLNNKSLIMIFIFQALKITILSMFIGTFVGIILAYLIPEIFNVAQSILNIDLLSTEIYPINYLPSQISYSDIIIINFITLFLAMISTIIPAIRASRINPTISLSDI